MRISRGYLFRASYSKAVSHTPSLAFARDARQVGTWGSFIMKKLKNGEEASGVF